MGRLINSSIYRLGRNLSWDISYPSIYFNKGMRFQIMFILVLERLMFLEGLRVIKVIASLEAKKIKFFLVAVSLFKESPLPQLFNDFKAGSLGVISFDEPRGFTKSKDMRNFDTFYDDLTGEHISEAPLYTSPISAFDNFFENFAFYPITRRSCLKESEIARNDLHLRRLASKAFLLSYMEKINSRGRFDSDRAFSTLMDISKFSKLSLKSRKYAGLKKELVGADRRLRLLRKIFRINSFKKRSLIELKKMFILLRSLPLYLNVKDLSFKKINLLLTFFGFIVTVKKFFFLKPRVNLAAAINV